MRSPNFERSIGRERSKIDPIATRTRRGKASPKLSEADRLLAGNMMEAGDLTMKEVADRLGVKTPALYQHIPPAKSSKPEG